MILAKPRRTPAYSGMTLASIDFVDNGPGVNTPFLRAVTVDTTTAPEPASIMATGLVGLFGVARRKRLS